MPSPGRFLGVLIVPLIAAAGAASIPVRAEPAFDHDLAVRIAESCNAESAFERRFGEKGIPGTHQSFDLPQSWGPWKKLDATYTKHSGVLFSVRTTAVFQDSRAAPDPKLASLAFDAIEAAIASAHRYVSHVAIDSYASYSFVGKPAYTLKISKTFAVVNLECWDDKLSIVDAEERNPPKLVARPLPPIMPLPLRPDAHICDNPASRHPQAVAQESQAQALNVYLAANIKYFADLAHWKGQQLVKKNAWTEDQRRTFLAATAIDPIIAREMERSADSLRDHNRRFLSSLQQQRVGAQRAPQRPADLIACQTTVDTLSFIYNAAQSAIVRGKRVQELYDAEARKRNVRFDD